jgi:hypothetical protein
METIFQDIKVMLRAIQKERHGTLASRAVLLHDNARPHNAVSIQAPLEHFNWELLDHAPNGHDPARSDYYLFTYLKNWLVS